MASATGRIHRSASAASTYSAPPDLADAQRSRLLRRLFPHSRSTPGTCSHRRRRARRRARRRLSSRSPVPRRRHPRRRQDDAGPSVPHRGARQRRTRPVRDAVGDGRGDAHRRQLAWLDAGRHRAVRTDQRGGAEPVGGAVDPVSGGSRTRRDDARHHERGRTPVADAADLRQPLGDAVARAGPAAVSPPDPRAQALLRLARLHRAAARRHDREGRRPAAAQHRARRDRSRSGDRRLRTGAPPPARRQDARGAVPGRRARRASGHRRSQRLPPPDRVGAPDGVHRRGRVLRHARARCAHGRRIRARKQLVARRTLRRGQDDDVHLHRGRGAAPGRAGFLLSLRRGDRHAALPLRIARHAAGGLSGERPARDPVARPGRRASSPTWSGTPSRYATRRSS